MNSYPWFVPISRAFLVAAVILSVSASASGEWKEKVLYSFKGGTDGWLPQGGVVFDSVGNLYGTTSRSGSEGCPLSGCGTVFEISPPSKKGGAWTETTLYTFQGISGSKTDGAVPVGGVIIDEQGNLYGTTGYGGNGPCKLSGSTTGCGIVYELSPPTQQGGQWTYTILYNFQGGKDGQFPWGNLLFDKKGNLYGATQFGGGKGTTCDPFYPYCGTVFRLAPPTQNGSAWTEKVLHSFKGGNKGKRDGEGSEPNGGLALGSSDAIYGTTVYGGKEAGGCDGGDGGIGCGTVFELAPPPKKGGKWTATVLWRFSGQDGATPTAGPVFDESGNLYGSASAGGNQGNGGIFELKKPVGKSQSWNANVLYLFETGSGGAGPEGSLILDGSGNLYGTTYYGSGSELQGSVFRLNEPHQNSGTWTINYLHGFVKPPDGMFPASGLVFDGSGNLYSTTQEGGNGTACGRAGCGGVFELNR
jgi:hypothetical protein